MDEKQSSYVAEYPVSPQEQLSLARSYARGKGKTQDYALAAYWYEKAAAQGNADAANYLGVLYANGNGVKKDPVQAAALYRQAAEAGHIMGAKNLGDCYRKGNGVKQDYTQAAVWYEKAAAAGNDKAAVQLGLLYAKGRGLDKDYTQAAGWYEQAVQKQNADAMNYLGVLCEFGRGVEKDLARATALYKQAAEAGHARAACNLANCYYDGRGIQQNYAQAAYWYEKATEGGIRDAFNSLGFQYDSGLGVEKDEDRAAKLYLQAAEKNHPLGTYNLALCYQLGTGVEQDPENAIFWYRQALSLDLSEETKTDAEYNIACCYLRMNMSGEPNLEQGLYWLNEAAAHNNAKAQQLLDSLLTPKPAPTAEDVKPISKKEKKQHTPQYRLTVLACVFLIGVVVCAVVGNLLNGPWAWFSAGKHDSRLYTFLFLNIPNGLGTLVGLPVSSTVGKLFTLLSSLFFLVISVKMYTTPVEESIDDSADGVDGPLNRIGYLLCCFSFFQMISSVMADNHTAIAYLDKSSFSFIPPLSLIAFTILDQMLCDSLTQKLKSICRILASLGFALGTAGLSQLVLTLQWENIILIPMAIHPLWDSIASLCGNSIFGSVVMVLLQCICSVLLGFCIKLLLDGTKEHIISVLAGGGIIYGLFLFHYLSGWFTQNLYSRIIVLWLFLLTVLFIWSILTRQQGRVHSRSTWIGAFGVISLPLICLDIVGVFNSGVTYNLNRFANFLAPLQEKIMGFIVKIFSVETWGSRYAVFAFSVIGLILFIALLVIFFFLYAPLNADKNKTYFFPADPRFVRICSWGFVLGYLLIFVFQDMLPDIGYYVCSGAFMVSVAGLTMCLIHGAPDITQHYGLGLFATVVMCVLISFFAELIAAILFIIAGIAILIAVLVTGVQMASAPRTKTDVALDRVSNALLGAAAMTDIASDYEKGKLSKQEAINKANLLMPIFKDKDNSLKDELEKMKDSDD